MGTTNISQQIEQGGAILQRLSGRPIPSALKPHVKTFETAYSAFAKADAIAATKRAARDEALSLVGANDDVLDADIDALATDMVGAKVGKRANPFVGFCEYSPSKLCDLPYATEAAAVLDLVTAVLAVKPGPVVTKAATKCRKSAEAVQSALQALTHPQSAYAEALAARDATLPDCVKALKKLKTHAKAAWDESPGTYEAVFAPPDKVQAPVKPQAKKRAKTILTKKRALSTGKGTSPPGNGAPPQ